MRARLGVGLAALVLLAGCGDGATDRRTAERPARFAQDLSWVEQDGATAVLHHGDEELEVPAYVEGLWPTPYGFFVEHRTGPGEGAGVEVVFTDGRTTRRLDGRPTSLTISPDGRYAAWIDRDGPRRPTGRLARVVVEDLRTGEQVLRDGRRMGGADDDLAVLYGELPPAIRGFAGDRVYWETPESDAEQRRLLRTTLPRGTVENGGRMTADLVEQPLEALSDRLVGDPTGMQEDGRASPGGDGLGGFVSPDGRWCLTDGEPGRLPVVRCGDGRRVTPAYPRRAVLFAGWGDADTYFVLGLDDGIPESWDPEAEDTSRGVLARCDLPSRRCTVLHEVVRTRSLVLGTGGTQFF